MKRFAVILSGCGVLDGSEIHEATLTMLYIKKAGCDYSVFAPYMDQLDVIDHYTKSSYESRISRNVLSESGRIARADIQALNMFSPENFDAIIFPGGYGVVKNLCTYSRAGHDFEINAQLKEKLIRAFELKKTVGAMCIAPIMMTKICKGCKITLGKRSDASEDAEKNGAIHVETAHGEVVFDEKYNLFSTPAYMLDSNIAQVAEGIENLIEKILKHLNANI